MTSYLVDYDTLLRNPTDIITKYVSYFSIIAKCDKSFINCVTFLLQNAIVITKFVDFIIKCVGTMSNKLRMMSKT